LRLRGLDLSHQVAPGVSFPLSVPIDSAWPDRFTGSTYDSLGTLAQQLNVSAWVIEHQLENHGIAAIEA